MPTTDEKNILKILEEEGGERGELQEVKISRYMGLRLDYIRSILGSMGRRNLIDVAVNGKITIADKGWRALGKTPPSPWGGVATAQENSTPESAEEKYERWLSGKRKEVSKEKGASEVSNEAQTMVLDSYAELTPEERLKKWTSK